MRFSNFSDGLWLPEGRDFAVPPNALIAADNIEYLLSGGVQGRQGRTALTDSALSGPVRALWRHYPRSGTASTLAVVDVGATTEFRHASGGSGTFTTPTSGTGFADVTDWGFANWPAKNLTFIANGSDALRSYNGTAIATVATGATNGIAPKKGPYITVHKSRLFATDPNELTHSVYASDVNDETEWPAINQISCNDPQGGTIKGLSSFFDFLIVLKSTSLFRFVGDISTTLGAQLALYSDRGCIAPSSIATTPYGIIFVGREGLYLTDGVDPNPQELSHPIRSLFVSRSSSTQYTTAVGRWYPRRNQYVLKLDPTASDAYVLTRIEVLSENPFIGERSRAVWIWSHHTSLPATAMSAWDAESDDGRLVVGDSSGNIWTFDSGTTDNGSAYTCAIQTASRALDASSRTGLVYRIKALHRGSEVMTGGIRYDQHSSNDVGFSIGSVTLEEKYPRVTLTDYSKMGRFVSLVLSNATDGRDFELHVLDADIRFRSARVWRNAN